MNYKESSCDLFQEVSLHQNWADQLLGIADSQRNVLWWQDLTRALRQANELMVKQVSNIQELSDGKSDEEIAEGPVSDLIRVFESSRKTFMKIYVLVANEKEALSLQEGEDEEL